MLSKNIYLLKHSLATVAALVVGRHPNKLNHTCLMYHSIKNSYYKEDDYYSLSFKKFSEQIYYLLEKKNKFIHFVDDGQTLTENVFSITFDDGFLDNYTEAAPFLIQHQIPFTIFVVSDFVDSSHAKYLNRNHIQELAQNPLVTIGAHGKSHIPLANMPLKKAEEELRLSKLEIENIIGKEVTTMSFPHGSLNDDLLRIASEVGYKKCGTSFPQVNYPNNASIRVDRRAIFFCETLTSFGQKINGQWDWILNKK